MRYVYSRSRRSAAKSLKINTWDRRYTGARQPRVVRVDYDEACSVLQHRNFCAGGAGRFRSPSSALLMLLPQSQAAWYRFLPDPLDPVPYVIEPRSRIRSDGVYIEH